MLPFRFPWHRWDVRLALLTTAAGLVTTGFVLLTANAPDARFTEAREALARARGADADRYAAAELRLAEAAWDSALAVWQAENRRFPILRDYRPAEAAALRATAASAYAARRAVAVRDSLHWVATVEGDAVRDQLTALEGQLRRLPARATWRTVAGSARTSLARSEAALGRNDYLTAAEHVRLAQAALTPLQHRVTTTLQTYLANLPEWRRWVETAIQESAQQGTPAIVVDKMARRLYVYRSGRLAATYSVELGPSWMGPKRHEGDLSTPEGRYHIHRKRGPGQTIYHRALEIDYPNAEDRRRFAEARRTGALDADARIGGLIEIHGEGGRGADWTRGCIALTNPEMEELFAMMPAGAPVTIVGALYPPSFLLAASSPAGSVTASSTR